MSNTQLTSEQRELLESPDDIYTYIHKIALILDGSEKYSDGDIHVIKDAIIRNKYWGHYSYIISNTDDPRLLIPFLDDNHPKRDSLEFALYYAIHYSKFEKARILIEYGVDIETTYEYVDMDDLKCYKYQISKFISPAVKSANKV